jgi:hypothetical protein
MSWDKLSCCRAMRRTMTCGVCGVTARLAGAFCLRCEFGVDCNDVSGWREFFLCLCLPPSEVKLWSAPSVVQYFLFRRWGKYSLRFSLFCGFENTGQSLQSDCLLVADLTERACRLRM